MTAVERENLKRWVDTWKVAGPMMEQFRKDDLAALTDEKALWMFESVTGDMKLPPRHDDGLLVQQQWFKKLASCPT